MEASFLFSSRLRIFRELTKRQTIWLNFNGKIVIFNKGRVAQRCKHFIFFAFTYDTANPSVSVKRLFSCSTWFVALSINSYLCYYPLAPPLPFPQSRENALKTAPLLYFPSYLKTAGEVPYTPRRGEINPCVGHFAAPPSRFLQLTPPDEPDRSAPPRHAFRGNQPTSPPAVMAERLSRGKISMCGRDRKWLRPGPPLTYSIQPACSSSRSQNKDINVHGISPLTLRNIIEI